MVWVYTEVGGVTPPNNNDRSVRPLAVYNDKLYAGVGTTSGSGGTTYNVRVYESSDGDNWSLNNEWALANWGGVMQTMLVWDDGTNGECLYAGFSKYNIGPSELWRYNGSTWTRVDDNGSFGYLYAAGLRLLYDIQDLGTELYAAGYSLSYNKVAWKSTDGGEQWTVDLEVADMHSGYDLIEFNGALYAVTSNRTSPQKTRIYKKSGGSWDSGTILDNTSVSSTATFVSHGSKLFLVTRSSTVGKVRVYSTEDGNSWTDVGDVCDINPNQILAFSSGGFFFINTTDDGSDRRLVISTDAQTWPMTEVYGSTDDPYAARRSYVSFDGYRYFGGYWDSADNAPGGVYKQQDIPVCWNYTARYFGSSRLFKASGCGSFPKILEIPNNVDKSTGKMIDDGVEIDPDEYEVR